MEPNIDGPGVWSRVIAQWQSVVLVGACVAGGLTLTTMVIGSTPDVVVQASEAAVAAAPVPEVPVVAGAPAGTVTATETTVAVDAASVEAAATVPGAAPAVLLAPVAEAAPAPAAPVAPAVSRPAPSAAPVTAPPPSSPAPAAVAAPAPAVPVTAAPTTAAPTVPQTAPTTAAPTTAAPVAAALSYPSYAAGSAGTVVLQFDGTSIYVASVTREANWVSQIDQNGPRTVEIKFFNTVTQRDEEFHATVESGRVKVEN